MKRLLKSIVLMTMGLSLLGCGLSQYEGLYTGNVEAVSLQLAFETSGKILEQAIEEGDVVQSGDVLSTLDTESLTLKRQGLALQIKKLENQRQLLVNRVSDAEASALESDLTSAESQLNGLRKDLNQQKGKMQEIETLYASGATSLDTLESAQESVRQLNDRIASASASVEALRSRIADRLMGPKKEELEALNIEMQLLAVQQLELDLAFERAVMKAPSNGTVETIYTQPGEFVSIGKPILKLLQQGQLYMTIYVPEKELHQIRIGQSVGFTDAFIDPNSKGTIVFISPVAEFTPKNVESTDSKHELVYRVKIAVEDSGGAIKPGMFLTVDLGYANE